ncbi:hypothetical protein F5X68DRAFT_237535 [Plectosphaerella plurivora]|uniref:Uncharacterized protein n=1 Tax=Plectosphaerella plurivora TaxID=936078 RepID=A0A9P9A635_9PEZI|nr:hypothetical protein F5X68DRAFT_237535 [Plectosphaerella plurivora]
MTGVANKEFKWYQVRKALTDYKTYAVLIGMPTGVIQTFAGLLVAVPQKWLTNMRVKIFKLQN